MKRIAQRFILRAKNIYSKLPGRIVAAQVCDATGVSSKRRNWQNKN
jgi:hypothetical protein